MKIKDFKIGATGEFPYGRLDDTDEGELRLALATDHQSGVVRVVFGKPVGWLALPTREARELGQMLIDKADELERRKS